MNPLETKASVIPVTEANFDAEVLNAGIPTLVDFWAEWCGPCKAIAPLMEVLAREYAGKLRVGKLNLDENPAAAGKFDIRSIPTLLLFKEGQIIGEFVGLQSKASLKTMIDRALSGREEPEGLSCGWDRYSVP